MSSTQVAVDREFVEHSFREWQEEQTLLDAQLSESVAALDSYQSHLDNWQQELAREREELRLLREAVERDQVEGSTGHAQVEILNQELRDSREKVSFLTTALLARTEELRELDRQREAIGAELALARSHEQELAASLAAQPAGGPATQHQAAFDKAVEEAATANHGDVNQGDASHNNGGKTGTTKVEPRRGTSPVLGSVMEQFGKLREQRSMNRSNSKPR